MDAAVVKAGRKSVGFMNLDGLIINLDYYGPATISPKQLATETADRQKTNGAKNVEIKEIKINDMLTQRIECDYPKEKSKLFLWLFCDENKCLHFASAEGPSDKVDAAVEIVEGTFSLAKKSSFIKNYVTLCIFPKKSICIKRMDFFMIILCLYSTIL